MIEPLTLADAERLYDAYMRWKLAALDWLREHQPALTPEGKPR